MKEKDVLITGGAGFIGTNLAYACSQAGAHVSILDNLSRGGTNENLNWLKENVKNLTFHHHDIRDTKGLVDIVKGKTAVYHLAAQVAVTTSVTNPREDFEINALGTFNILEAIRLTGEKPVLIFSSTNKVYGGMEDIIIEKKDNRYTYRDYPQGLPDSYPLDFHSPYGCSKGAADQYVRDYSRIYDIPSVVFRQSCIYGPHQFGLEDQGWIAWFMIASLLGKPMTIYGDGMQVRDILFVDDLVRAFLTATDKIEVSKGKIYNVGGGPNNTLAVWSEFGPILEEMLGKKITIKKGDWRPGDQKVYVSNIDKIKKELAWEPQVGVRDGLGRLFEWVKANREMLSKYF